MRRRATPNDLPAGVEPGRLPRHLAGNGQAYAEHVGLDWATQYFEARNQRFAAERAWFAERGLLFGPHGRIDYNRARALGLYPPLPPTTKDDK